MKRQRTRVAFLLFYAFFAGLIVGMNEPPWDWHVWVVVGVFLLSSVLWLTDRERGDHT